MTEKSCGKKSNREGGRRGKAERICGYEYDIMPKGLIYNGGDDSREDPPVPIPNTEVKLSYADGTASRGRVGSCRLSNKVTDTQRVSVILFVKRK